VKTVEEVTGKKVNRVEGVRRVGDPPALVADPTRAQQLLKWKAHRSLHDIVSSAWKWMQRIESKQRTGVL
jgi:UDP-glucose 4-epimerase